jgi:hypothetical protein
MAYNRARFHWMPVGRDSFWSAPVSWRFFVTKRDGQLESAKTLAHSKSCRAQLALFSIQTQMVLWSIQQTPQIL